MSLEFTSPLSWTKQGVEPSDTLKQQGFKGAMRPPAEIFNYFWHRTGTCISELQGFLNWDTGIKFDKSCVAFEKQMVTGQYNNSGSASGRFIVGTGTSESDRVNGFRVSNDSKCYGANAFVGSGADYAEMFEWTDGNSENEDRRGFFVTLDGEKIRIANAEDDYILGVVSSNPSFLGDSQSEQWQGKYLRDVFGSVIYETIDVDGKQEQRPVLNPEYDPNKEYISRENRHEWVAVGMIGKLIVVDDGTCQTNGYCKVTDSGTATNSTEKTAFRVLSRIDENHIKILFK